MSIMGISFPGLNTVLPAGVGFVAPPILEGFLRPMLPAALAGNIAGRYLVKGVSVLGTSLLARAVTSRQTAKLVAMGGVLYIFASAWMDFVQPYLSGIGAGAGSAAALSAYVRPNMRAYVPPSGPRGQLGYPSAAFSGGDSGAVGGTAVRFKRF